MSRLTKIATDCYARLRKQLAQIDELHSDPLQKNSHAVNACLKALLQLQEQVIKYPFANPAEEIHFFRTGKPPITAELIYHTKIYQLHTNWPAAGIPGTQEYLRNALLQVQTFFADNREFYVYHRTGNTDRDHLYFTRASRHIHLLPPGIYTNPADTFSTGYDLLLAHLLANEPLKEYLEQQLLATEKGQLSLFGSPSQSLKWTDDMFDIIELAYALHEKGACNHGSATLAQITTALSQAFNINLHQHRRYWIDIRRRKSDKPSYMEQLFQNYKKRLDKPDNNSRH